MFKFGARSRSNLDTCHPDLIRLGEEAIATSTVDFSCTEGYRSPEQQMVKFQAGLSKLTQSKHNLEPAHAVHFDPYPIMYPEHGDPEMVKVKKYARYYMLAMHIRATATRLGIPIRWGGDWDRDNDIMDQTFDDLAHYELDSP